MQRIEDRLTALGLTWAALARNVGLSDSSGSQWSGRRVFPKERTHHAIAKALGVEMGWLLTGDEPRERRLAQTETELAMLEALRRLPPDRQRIAVNQTRALAPELAKTLRDE